MKDIMKKVDLIDVKLSNFVVLIYSNEVILVEDVFCLNEIKLKFNEIVILFVIKIVYIVKVFIRKEFEVFFYDMGVILVK